MSETLDAQTGAVIPNVRRRPTTGETVTNKVLEAVQDLLPKIAERADQCERDRRIPDETIAELKEAGVFAMLQPKRRGGLEADQVGLCDVLRTTPSGC